MPEEPKFATEIAPAIKDFHVEASRLVMNEGLPFLELVLSHVAAPHKIVLRVEGNCGVYTEGGGKGGVARIIVTATPQLQVNMINMERKEETKP